MAFVKCKECSNLYSDTQTKCPECGTSFSLTDKSKKDRALESFKSQRDMSIPDLPKRESGENIQLKTLYAVRSIAIFLLCSFFSGAAFAYAAYIEITDDYTYTPNPVVWVPWTFGWVLLLVGVTASTVNLVASAPKK